MVQVGRAYGISLHRVLAPRKSALRLLEHGGSSARLDMIGRRNIASNIGTVASGTSTFDASICDEAEAWRYVVEVAGEGADRAQRSETSVTGVIDFRLGRREVKRSARASAGRI